MQHRPRIRKHDRSLGNSPAPVYVFLRRRVRYARGADGKPSKGFFHDGINVGKVWAIGEGREAERSGGGGTEFDVEFVLGTALYGRVKEERKDAGVDGGDGGI
jgi:hypothetical protein